MADIFISYARSDKAAAEAVAGALAAEGFTAWWDTSLVAGESWSETIRAELKAAKVVLVLWSRGSWASRWVQAEAHAGHERDALVAARLDEVTLEPPFNIVQTADLRPLARDPACLASLIAGVKRKFGNAAPPTEQRPQSTATPAETLLAVLPFDNLSADADMAFFSDGVSEDILSRIQRGSALKVIGRTSAFQFRGSDKAKAAAALRATHVLDGSIRRSGAKVRIAAHLTEATTQTTLWSDKYDRGLEDIFAVQDEISEAIAAALKIAFSAAKTQKIDPALYDLFLRARAPTSNPLYRSADATATMETITRLAPDFAPAWGALAFMLAAQRLRMPYRERATLRATIEGAIAKCRAGEPGNADAQAAEYLLLDPFGAFLRQEEIIHQYKDTQPTDASAILIPGFLESVGRGREAVEACRRVQSLDVLSASGTSMLGLVQWRSGALAEGKAAMLETLEKWPDMNDGAVMLMIAGALEGDWDLVDRLTDPARLARFPLGEYQGVVSFAETARNPTLENRTLWIDALRRLVDKTGHGAEAFRMVFTASFGFADEVFELIDRAKLGPSGDARDQLGFLAFRPSAFFMKAFPELRRDPRFVKLCARLGLVEYWLETQKWPDCAEEVAPHYDFRAECEKYRDHPKDKFFD